MFRVLGILAGLVAFPWVCYHCVTGNGPLIQSRLQSIVAGAESAAAVTGVEVTADGREIVLAGEVPTQEMRARAALVAAALPGVRTVDNRLTVAPLSIPSLPSLPAGTSGATAGAATAPPQPPPVTAQAQIDRLLGDARIQFDTGRDTLLPVSIPVLEQVAEVLTNAPSVRASVEGHTDNVGAPAANRALSAARARAVVEWLAAHGVDRSRLRAEGFGPDRPLTDNSTPDGRARNRRVDILAR